MANTLGSSPLNLTFDAISNTTNKISRVADGSFVRGIFDNTKTAISPTGINSEGWATSTRTNLHTNDDYDTTISELIRYTADDRMSAMRLTAADFAYLKNVGVFPNNRLIIVRRFPSPVQDDLTALHGTKPIATLISWVPDNNDFIDISFGEKWVQTTDASFRTVLNDIGGDFQMSSDHHMNTLGNSIENLGNSIPLAGFMEGLQYKVFKNMGLSDTDAANLPLGNPNLIRAAMRRATLDRDEAGSGLKCEVSIKMTVEYEQKFINGVDPTLVYYDIIANALAFGTSDAQFQFSKGLSGQIDSFINNLSKGTVAGVNAAIKQFLDILVKSIKGIADTLLDALVTGNVTNTITSIPDNLLKLMDELVGGTISKYRVRILGITNALTGQPSVPYHICVGNPKRPLFCSGDMVVENVKLSMGKTLAFNDLPSSIKLEFELKNARPWGAQEIFRKFNIGKGRTYKRLQSTYEESSNFGSTSSNNSNTSTQNQTKQLLQNASLNAQQNSQAFQNGAALAPNTTGPGSTPLTNISDKTPTNDLVDRQNYLLGKQTGNRILSASEQKELNSIQTQISLNNSKKILPF